MTSLGDFLDRISSCQSADDVDAVWQSWCTDLGFPRAGIQTTRLKNNRLIMERLRSNNPQELVDHYIEERLFRFSQSVNPLRRIAHLEGMHLDTIASQSVGKPSSFREFVSFIRDIEIPAEMWARFPTSNGQSVTVSLWSDTCERDFLLRLKDLRRVYVPASSLVVEKLKAVGLPIQPTSRRPLSSREKDCLLWLATGDRQAEIADRLSIDIKTVEMHLRNAREKLDARTSHQAVAQAIVQGYVIP